MKSKIIQIIVVVGLLLANLAAIAQDKYTKLGNQAFDQYQYQLAIEFYQKALKRSKPKKDEQNMICRRMAETYYIIGNWKQSASYYKRISTNGYMEKNPKTMFNYAVALQYLGEMNLATDYYRQYIQLLPSDTLAQRNLAGLLASGNSIPSTNYVINNEKILNSRDDDFGIVFLNKKSTELILTSTRKEASGKDTDQWTGAQFSDFFIVKEGKNGKLQRPILADDKGVLNTPANEGVPFMNKDFSTLYYTRCIKAPKSKNDNALCVILKTERNGSRWSKPEGVLENSTGNVGHPALTSDELTMIYSGSKTGGSDNKDLWIINRESKRKPFQNPENLGTIINTPGDELFPYLFNDSTLYFASDGLGGFGGLDLYITYRDKSGEWSTPENLGVPFNSNRDDFGIVFNDNNRNKGYFCSNREGSLGGDDIFSFQKANFQYSLSGKLRDASTLLPLQNIEILLIQNSDTLKVLSNSEGIYRVENDNLKEETDYSIIAGKENYFTKKIPFTTAGVQNDHDWVYDIDLIPIPESPIVLPEIRYDFNKWDLLPQYQDSLRIFVKILNDNPKIQIELRSHTDSRATEQYNKELSQNRAQSVVGFLINEGIDPGRLIAKGYGKTSPRVMENDYRSGVFIIPKGTVLNDDYLNSLKTPEEKEIVHQLNRRTELYVISKNYSK